jgi:hypothetical protein
MYPGRQNGITTTSDLALGRIILALEEEFVHR